MSAQIGDALIGGNQPTLLHLDTRPEGIVGQALPTLVQRRHRIMAMRAQHLSDLPGQVLVHLDARAHRLLS
jgi:hypothetical protein